MERGVERILLVDDTLENLDVLRGLLTNYKKSIALNGVEALNLAQCDNKPDLILLDIMMPKMDGYETCKRLKENSCTKDIPVIFMTALSETVDKLKGFKIGAVDYVTKPFHPEELLKRVEIHLKIARLQNELKNHNALLEQKVNERTVELQKSNEKLLIAKEQAEASDKLKGEFLAQISHEIRTPLNSVINLSGLVVDEFSDKVDEDFEEIITGINESGLRIIRTVEHILNYSEIISGGYKFEPTEVNINKYVQQEFENIRKSILAKGIQISFINNVQIDVGSVDPNSIEIIIRNIIENALIFTEEGKIDIELKKDENNFIFECRDTGIGISKDFMQIIFEPFSQEDQSYTRSIDGIGLGMPLSKKHCELNSIELEIESEKGAGTTVRVTFQR